MARRLSRANCRGHKHKLRSLPEMCIPPRRFDHLQQVQANNCLLLTHDFTIIVTIITITIIIVIISVTVTPIIIITIIIIFTSTTSKLQLHYFTIDLLCSIRHPTALAYALLAPSFSSSHPLLLRSL